MTGRRSRWLMTGDEALAELCHTIGSARKNVRLEMYIYSDGNPGTQVLESLVSAARRGISVQVLIDGLGSAELPGRFFDPLLAARGEVRTFNPLSLRRLPVRNHRKLLVVDTSTAITGGFNIAPEYLGDGITSGWRDIGIVLNGCIVAELAKSFDAMWERAASAPLRFARIRPRTQDLHLCDDSRYLVLPSGPGRGRNSFYVALRHDIETASDIRMAVAYFLPALRLRRTFRKVVRRGGRVRIVVPGRSDVAISRQAGRFLYGGLLRAGVEIREYSPQVLHAKLYLVDDVVYVGSSNLDSRSLHINYELMVRVSDPEIVADARKWFDDVDEHSVAVDPKAWGRSRNWIDKLRERWSYLLLARLDPYLTRWLAEDPR
jgi:cardiolipin synthase